jgi:asparagine synthase (glutamine-hydrolysing)
MADSLGHRGPDDSGVLADGRAAFAFRRLSILDLSPAGHQPFSSEDGSVALVFNGEIYNYAELRDELRALGHHFRSTGDTEVLLHAYLEWGVDCLQRLNGMWAFLIHDRRQERVFGARDRFGVKPLYCASHDGAWYFGSEIKALQVALPATGTKVDVGRVARFIAAGRLEQLGAGPATFFDGISQVEPGSWFEIRPDGERRDHRYWRLPEEDAARPDDPVEEFAALFTDTVRLRMRSDVPVGVSLSGGLDSTAIISTMARLREESGARTPLHAFSYMPPEFDERPFIERTIERTSATLHRVEADPASFWTELPRLLHHHDEPVHSATAYVSYNVYRTAAAAGVKVVLCGQGADETWGGYFPYFRDQWYTLLRSGRLGALRRQLGDYAAGHSVRVRDESIAVALRFVLVMAGRTALYRAAMRQRRNESAYPFRQLLHRDLAVALPTPESHADNSLRGMLVSGTMNAPLPLYLRLEDRNSMAHSVEARLPFLDFRLVSLAFRLGGEWKINGRWNKYLVRQALRGAIPEEVRTRVEKMGFPTPMAAWFRGDLQDRMAAMIDDAGFDRLGIFDRSAVRALLRRHRSGERSAASALFNVAQTEMWLRLVGERAAAAPRAEDARAYV